MGCRHRPAGSARGLPPHWYSGSFVHRSPSSAEVSSPDEAGRLPLVADQLQRHHHHQGMMRCMSAETDRE